MKNTVWKKELDAVALNIEFLLISVIQGMALQFLVLNALKPLETLQYEYWFYIVSAFLLILIFWSQAIIHALSFISWPVNLGHTFLYFLASCIEVLAFYEITNPFRWFLFGTAFLLIGSCMYYYDLKMIKNQRNQTEEEHKKYLFDDIYKNQKKELTQFLPVAILFNCITCILFFSYANFFIDHHYHVIFAALQSLFSLVLLSDTVKQFKKRTDLITQSYKQSSHA